MSLNVLPTGPQGPFFNKRHEPPHKITNYRTERNSALKMRERDPISQASASNFALDRTDSATYVKPPKKQKELILFTGNNQVKIDLTGGSQPPQNISKRKVGLKQNAISSGQAVLKTKDNVYKKWVLKNRNQTRPVQSNTTYLNSNAKYSSATS